ncbi:MAG: hypothetical protein ABIA59_01700, partial [Candidatus Latescibacterota bacterium]
MNRSRSNGKSIVMFGLLVLAIAVPDIGQASEHFAKVGSYAATILRFPRGARGIALGGCGAADPSTPMNIYYNPAVAFLIRGVHLVQGYNEWPADIDFQDYGVYAGRSFKLGSTTHLRIGGGIRYTHLRLDSLVKRMI